MARRLAAAIALVALLLLIAWRLFRVTFEPSPRTAQVPVATIVRAQGELSPSAPDASVIAPLEPAPTDDRIQVMRLEGKVERRASGSGWAELQPGEELRQADAIRTGRQGRVLLGLSGDSTVEVSPESEFTVAEISRSVARVRVEEGRISAVIREGGGRLKVEARGSDATAETGVGAFSVLASGHGQMTVAATEGSVTLTSSHGTVVVNAGEQSIARAGETPTAPMAIPHSLFLKVGKPPELQRERELTVVGQTEPGAVVTVNGNRVEPSANGSFSVPVELRDGPNAVQVEVEDAAGNRRVRNLPVEVKTQVKRVNARVIWSSGGDGT